MLGFIKNFSLQEFLTIKESAVSKKVFWSVTFCVYLVAVAIKLIWFFNNASIEQYWYLGAPIINSMDGFYYAQGARDILDWDFSRLDSPTDRALPILTAVLAKIFFFVPFEWVIFLMPAVLIPLVVFPIAMLAKELGRPLIGWAAAILAVLTTGFYTRTIVGYYDDDVLTMVLPIWLTWAYIMLEKEKNIDRLFWLLAITLFYSWWYINGAAIMLGFVCTFALYILFFSRKDYFLIFALSLCLIAISIIPLPIKIVLLALILVAYKKYDSFLNLKISLISLSATFALFVGSGGADNFIAKWKFYIFKPNIPASGELKLHYYSSLKTVAESKYSDFSEIVSFLSVNGFWLTLSLVGVALLIYRYRGFWFLLPTLALGFLAIDGGIRFTPYGAFALSFGLVYIAALFSQKFPREWLFAPILCVILAYPLGVYFKKALEYNPASSLTNSEVEVLAKMKEVATSKDYIFSWWDWGYPVRYYSHSKTHSDGGMQDGSRTFIESQALSTPNPAQAAHILREAAEMTEKVDSGQLKDMGGTFANIMRHNKLGFVRNSQDMLYMLGAGDYPVSDTTRNVYWGLFYRMFQINGTIAAFSQRDLQTGQYLRQNFFATSNSAREEGDKIFLDHNLVIDKKSGEISDGKQKTSVGAIVKVGLGINGGKPISSVSTLRQDGTVIVIDWKPYNMYIVCDALSYKSMLVQMFVFDNYDSRFFDKVIESPLIKVFKVKN